MTNTEHTPAHPTAMVFHDAHGDDAVSRCHTIADAHELAARYASEGATAHVVVEQRITATYNARHPRGVTMPYPVPCSTAAARNLWAVGLTTTPGLTTLVLAEVAR